MARTTYPYLGKYKDTSQYSDVIVLMTEPNSGVIVYIPPDVPESDARYDLYLTERMTPSRSELDPYTGSVVLRSDQDPTLGS